MKVRLDYDIFQSAVKELQQQELFFLLNILTYKQRYELIVNDDVRNTVAYAKMSESDKAILDQALTYSITASITEGDCTVKSGGDVETDNPIFSVEEAIRYLLQPLSVIVENSLNDAHFLLAIFRSFDESGKLLEGYKNGWLQFDNAGGCDNLPNFLESRRQFFGGKIKFLHCYVLLDGDKRFPEDRITKNDKLIKQMKEWNIPYHVLEKRCMENYLPEDAMVKLLGNKTNREWLNAYQCLSSMQKDYFSIAGGFQKELTKNDLKEIKKEMQGKAYKKALKKPSLVKKRLSNELKLFYKNVSETNFIYLEQGLMLKGSFKDTYPKAFDDVVFVYRKALERRTAHQHNPHELQQIKDEILKML